jgi:hypothetical protein
MTLPTTAVALVGYAGVTVLILAWLVVSFSKPSPRRVIVEWFGACGLYLALVSLFVHLSMRAQEAGTTPAMVAFGFLVALFGSGLVVSLVQTLLAFRSPGRLSTSATN